MTIIKTSRFTFLGMDFAMVSLPKRRCGDEESDGDTDQVSLVAGLWHRVDVNESDRTRINIFYDYELGWIVASDRWRCHPSFMEQLNREQRILMRDYDFSNTQIKLPPDDYPWFADARSVEGQCARHAPMLLRRHPTRSEEGF